MCTTSFNTNLRVRRLTINFERTCNSQIVTLSETDVSATLTFTSTFAIFDTLVERPPGYYTVIGILIACVTMNRKLNKKPS